MDSQRFDDLARSLTAARSRRGALRLLAGAALAAVAGRAEPAGARERRDCPSKPCRPGYRRDRRTCKCECQRRPCQGGKEFDLAACTCTCPSGLKDCGDGVCVGQDQCCPDAESCPEDPRGCCDNNALSFCTIDGCCDLAGPDKQVCNGFCVDTKSSNSHCGGCGVACGPCQRCENGACVDACGPGETCCGGRCTAGDGCPPPDNGLCGGKIRCVGEFSQCCTGGAEPTCCREQPLHYCKVSSTGRTICSTNP